MSKQKIIEWLEKQNPSWLEIASKADIIHQYTKDQSGWISVDELLPQEDFEVDAFSGDDVVACIFRMNEDGSFYFDGLHNVTHWKPRPLPPTDGV